MDQSEEQGREKGGRSCDGERDEMNGGSNTAAQNSQSNPTKQITPNFPGDSYARCPFALHSRQLRSKGTLASFYAREYRARQRFISRRPYFRRLFSSTLTVSQTLNLCGVRLGWAIERARPFYDRDRSRRVTNASKCIACRTQQI